MMGQVNPSSTSRDQVSKDAVVWPTLRTHFAGYAVSFKIQLLESGD